jgi:Skp family chaperone for outer membrane proteins
MNIIRYFALSIAFATLFSVQVAAQTTPARIPAAVQTATPAKIAVINSAAFSDEKAGITKFVGAFRQLNTEFVPVQKELETLNTRLNTLAKEIDTMREQVSTGKIPIDEKSAQAKVELASQLQRDLKFKTEDAKARFERRQQDLILPVLQDIGKALSDFAKLRGFSIIFDVSKDETGILVAIGDEKLDATKDFIAYYNTRPATTTPKTTP